jgi:hypothetical protein
MSTLTKQTKKGVLKYRLPNIAEGYEYLALIDTVEKNSDLFKIKAQFIMKMSDLLEWKELGYESYNEVLNDKENMKTILSDIASEIFSDITGTFEKKSL